MDCPIAATANSEKSNASSVVPPGIGATTRPWIPRPINALSNPPADHFGERNQKVSTR